MNFGMRPLKKLKVNGNDYFLMLNKVEGDGGGEVGWFFFVVRGDWQAAKTQIVGDPGQALYNYDKTKDPYQAVNDIMVLMEVSLKKSFTPDPPPITWEEKVDDACIGYGLRTDGTEVMVVSQYLGNKPGLNKYIIAKTGYNGDFRDGQFTEWATQNGIDAQTLIDEYNSLT